MSTNASRPPDRPAGRSPTAAADRRARRLRTVGGGPGALHELCRGAAEVAGVDGAAVSLRTGPDADLLAYGASDHTAAYVDELQFTVGEGPNRDAAAREAPVLAGSLGAAARRWPAFAPAAVAAGVEAVYAFPVRLERTVLGVLDLFSTRAGRLGREQLVLARSVADLLAVPLLALADGGGGLGGPTGLGEAVATSRTETQRAIGMVAADLSVDHVEALVRLRAAAFARDLTAAELAHLIVRRRLRLDRR